MPRSLTSRSYSRVAPQGSRQPTTIEELLDVVFVCMSGCWIWLGGDDGRGGYGRILRPGTRNTMAAHRYVYQYIAGKKIPPGYDVDHLCRAWTWHPTANRRCVNPDHLEAVPPEVNQRRKIMALHYTRDLPLEEGEAAELPPEKPPAPLLAPGESDTTEWL